MTVPLFPRHKNNNYFITQTDIYKNLLITHSFQQVILLTTTPNSPALLKSAVPLTVSPCFK